MQLSLENKSNPKNDETWQRYFSCYRLFGFFSNLKFLFCFVSSLSSCQWVCVCVCVCVCVLMLPLATMQHPVLIRQQRLGGGGRGWTGKRNGLMSCVCAFVYLCVCVCVLCFRIFKDSKKIGFACMFGHDLDKQVFLFWRNNETKFNECCLPKNKDFFFPFDSSLNTYWSIDLTINDYVHKYVMVYKP